MAVEKTRFQIQGVESALKKRGSISRVFNWLKLTRMSPQYTENESMNLPVGSGAHVSENVSSVTFTPVGSIPSHLQLQN